MKPEIKQKWIEALLSGEYEQGTKVLRSPDNKFCCLGILCDLYSKEHPEVEWKEGKECFSIFRQQAYVPVLVVEWSGLGSCTGIVENEKESLSVLNDTGSSFEEIANIIDRNL